MSAGKVDRLDDGQVAVTGSRAELVAFVDRARRSGQLAGFSAPQPTGRPGIWCVNVRLLPRVESARRPPRWLWAVVVGLVLAGALAWAVVQLVAWLLANLWLVIVVGVIAAWLVPRGCRVTIIHRH